MYKGYVICKLYIDWHQNMFNLNTCFECISSIKIYEIGKSGYLYELQIETYILL